MCTTCGCGEGEARIEGEALHPHDHSHPHTHGDDPHWHVHADGTAHSHAPSPEVAEQAHGHSHEHDHAHSHDHAHGEGQLNYGSGPAGAHAPGMSQSRMVQIEKDILSKNDAYAARNRQQLGEKGVLALNLVSSPGSGKTTLLCRTVEALRGKVPVAVVEGDQQTSFDADRIRATGAPALQINTGKGCHLDAHMVGHALEQLKVAEDSLLLLENVGNLVCPAAFDLGEAAKVVILSVTEGEDKPLKYPDMFRAAQLMVLSKCDLLPHLQFDADQAEAYARRVNPQLEVIRLSSTTGEGFGDWLAWIEGALAKAKGQRQATVAGLKARIAQLEAQLAAQGDAPSAPTASR